MTATLIPSQSSGILLTNISWKTYESLLNELTQQGGIRLTYDRGRLEIITPSAPHEKSGELLGNFVEILTDELNVDICSLGSLTCKRQDLERGLEADKCYYIQNEDIVWNKRPLAKINRTGKMPVPQKKITFVGWASCPSHQLMKRIFARGLMITDVI